MKYDSNSLPRSALKTTNIPQTPRKHGTVSKGYTEVILSLTVGASVWLPTTSGSAYSLAAASRIRPGYEGRQYIVRKEQIPTEVATEYSVPADTQGARVWRTA